MNGGGRDPYEAYLEQYYQLRKDIGPYVDNDAVEDVLFDAMGQKPREVPEHLHAVHDFVRHAVENKVSIPWVLLAEADAREIMKIQESIVTIGKRIGAKITLQSKGRALSRTITAGIEEEIGMHIVASILQEEGPKIMSLLSPECFSDITVDIVDMRNNECLANIVGSWKHPISGREMPMKGTVTLQTPTLTIDKENQ